MGEKNNMNTTLLENEGMMSSSEVAKMLNVHINTIRRWSSSGFMDCYRIGPRQDRRFSQQNILAFLNKSEELQRERV